MPILSASPAGMIVVMKFMAMVVTGSFGSP